MDKEEKQMNKQMESEFNADQKKSEGKVGDMLHGPSADDILKKIAQLNSNQPHQPDSRFSNEPNQAPKEPNHPIQTSKIEPVIQTQPLYPKPTNDPTPKVTVKVTMTPEEKRAIELQEKALKPPVIPPDSAKLRRKKEISFRLSYILAEYGGLESNVPVQKDTEYWKLLDELRAL